MLSRSVLRHYVDEDADLMRNPFEHKTRIDCDKLFVSDSVDYADALKTKNRPNVAADLMETIERIISRRLHSDSDE